MRKLKISNPKAGLFQRMTVCPKCLNEILKTLEESESFEVSQKVDEQCDWCKGERLQ